MVWRVMQKSLKPFSHWREVARHDTKEAAWVKCKELRRLQALDNQPMLTVMPIDSQVEKTERRA
jgi:hypothetical protein